MFNSIFTPGFIIVFLYRLVNQIWLIKTFAWIECGGASELIILHTDYRKSKQHVACNMLSRHETCHISLESHAQPHAGTAAGQLEPVKFIEVL